MCIYKKTGRNFNLQREFFFLIPGIWREKQLAASDALGSDQDFCVNQPGFHGGAFWKPKEKVAHENFHQLETPKKKAIQLPKKRTEWIPMFSRYWFFSGLKRPFTREFQFLIGVPAWKLTQSRWLEDEVSF